MPSAGFRPIGRHDKVRYLFQPTNILSVKLLLNENKSEKRFISRHYIVSWKHAHSRRAGPATWKSI